MSHWAVYSTAATELTTKTFATLAATPGLGRAEAFRRAMLDLIAEGKPPAYWAPFVVVGEGGRATGSDPRPLEEYRARPAHEGLTPLRRPHGRYSVRRFNRRTKAP